MFRDYLRAVRPRIDDALNRLLPQDDVPDGLEAAMRYAVFAGGKRVRPALVLLGAEAGGGSSEDLEEAAAALELIHTFSLVHDDLPALDDDDLRRGRETLHRRYNEAIAILAGDALLNVAYEVLATQPSKVAADVRLRAVRLVSIAVGAQGMIGGQVLDLAAERGGAPDDRVRARALLESIHRGKTGALLSVSLRLGGIYVGVDEQVDGVLRRVGDELGLLFQIGDDILDVVGTSEQLGKTAGKDAAANKLTYPALYGLEKSRELLHESRDRCFGAADELPAARDEIRSLADYLVERQS